MFADNLKSIRKELSNYHRDKSELDKYYVQLRLNKSLKSYYSDLSDSVNYLSHRNIGTIVQRIKSTGGGI